MATKIAVLKTTDVTTDVYTDGVPLTWFDSIANKVRSKVPNAERELIKVHGLENVTFQHFHTLTAVEEAQEVAAAALGKLASVTALVPPSGPLTEEQANALRAALAG